MTQRKPPGMSFETWTEQQVQHADRAGAFDNLEGAGKPIPSLGAPHDPDWWTKSLIKREGIPAEELLPEPLKLRREIEHLPETVKGLWKEQQVRDLVEGINKRVTEWIRFGTGPWVAVTHVDVEKVVADWREFREARRQHQAAEATAAAKREAERKPWWRRALFGE
ncbi:DnaJ family domain-containing protein [Kribbella deserti]|uniref:DUF1992 domain-containing protein n=1 Tax=Kribbella deserti TaxID=1926257 RepID=A0ABV6QIX2_9ACTN